MKEKGMWELINANEAAAHAVRLARVKVIPIYPITPQTMIVEVIEEFIAKGLMTAEYIRVESEHSAMAAAIGASSAGVRTFTATASQGLLYMHEVLHWAAGSRLPIGMAVVNRAVGPPWNIHADHQDAISQRDTGWMEFFVSSSQEALDSILIMYRVAENNRVLLPFMVCMDAFILSHTHMPVNIPDQDDVDYFLPEYRPPHWSLDPDNPVDMGNLTMPEEEYMEMRWSIERGMKNAREVFKEAADKFYEIFGRRYEMVHATK
jgi:Pyruvate:ferredoxin oxidoreductase and related 2-oxoacid:ferredoxin oxidoreductases, alpha subunit